MNFSKFILLKVYFILSLVVYFQIFCVCFQFFHLSQTSVVKAFLPTSVFSVPADSRPLRVCFCLTFLLLAVYT